MESLQQKELKNLRNLLVKNKQGLSYLLVGILFLVFGGFNYHRVRILSFTTPPEIKSSQTQIQGVKAIGIIIPSIEIDLPIDEGEINDGVWSISYSNATHLNSSSNIGGRGNIVIYGHNKKSIFGNLPYLSVGQEITLKTEDGDLVKYKVYQKDFVSPDRVDLLAPTDYEELTVYTCWGLFDNQRVVIKAKPVI